jgi:hypothetical protein
MAATRFLDLSLLDERDTHTALQKVMYIYVPESQKVIKETFRALGKAGIIEVSDKNTLYILPAGYSQSAVNSKVTRQLHYNTIRFNCPAVAIRLVKETENQHDSKAIAIDAYRHDNDRNYHLGYIPRPLNEIIYKKWSRIDSTVVISDWIDEMNGQFTVPIIEARYTEIEDKINERKSNSRFIALMEEE